MRICRALLSCKGIGTARCIRASWVFTKNDALANFGTVIGGVLVLLTQTALPDLVLGLIVCVVVARGGIEIIRDTKSGVPRKVIANQS